MMNYCTSKHNEIQPTKNVKITFSYYAPAREVYRREHRAWTVHAQGEAGEAAWLRYQRADAQKEHEQQTENLAQSYHEQSKSQFPHASYESDI